MFVCPDGNDGVEKGEDHTVKGKRRDKALKCSSGQKKRGIGFECELGPLFQCNEKKN